MAKDILQSTSSEEIRMLEKMAGVDPEQVLRNRKVRRAIRVIKQAWLEEPGRAQADIHSLLTDQAEWRWPLKVYSPEEKKKREDNLRKILKANSRIPIKRANQGSPFQTDKL